MNAQGQPGTPRVATWDLKTDSIAAKPSFGGFQFAQNESLDTVLEFFDGTSGGQVAASGFTFGTRNPVVQLVGKTGAPVTLAPRGTASPSEFNGRHAAGPNFAGDLQCHRSEDRAYRKSRSPNTVRCWWLVRSSSCPIANGF